MSVSAFPLHWPKQRPRKIKDQRRTGRFSVKTGHITQAITINEAVVRLQAELDRIGAENPILSSNLQLRLDGFPRSGQGEPADPGVAVYFDLDGRPHCLPCDTYTKTAQNIAAIAAHIEATRAIERYGVSSVTEMFTGFAALPPPSTIQLPGRRNWWEVLGVSPGCTKAEAQSAYRDLAMKYHKEGRSDDDRVELNAAKEDAKAFFAGK